MLIVALDVMALLANVFIQLIACEMHQKNEEWVQGIILGLETAGLVFSSLFMIELAACLFSFGFEYALCHQHACRCFHCASLTTVPKGISLHGFTFSTLPSLWRALLLT
jgi:uncharacterized membrane protein